MSLANARARAISVAVSRERAAAAVEDEVVVAAHLIHIEHRRVVLGCEASEHSFAQQILAGGERRRREIDDGFSARSGQVPNRVEVIAAPLPEIAIVPDVLADADAETPIANLEDFRTARRFEVPVLVEHVVGRKERLAEPLADRAVLQKHRGVEERASFIRAIRLRQADDDGGAVRERAGERRERVPAAADEAFAEQEIARQVAGECELRRDGQIGALFFRRERGVCDQPRIAGQISHRGIDLKKRDLH